MRAVTVTMALGLGLWMAGCTDGAPDDPQAASTRAMDAPDMDADRDGLSNVMEAQIGMDPAEADTNASA